MTVSSTISRVVYTASAAQTEFPFAQRFLADSDLKVYVGDVLKTITTHYTVTGAGEAAGGLVTFNSGLTAGQVVSIRRSPEITQLVDYVENDPFPAETHEEALDLLTMICQSLQEQVDRAVMVPISSTTDPQDLLDELAGDVADAANSASAALASQVAAAASAAEVADTVADLADDTDPAKGAALIGYQGRTVRARLGEVVSVKDHGAVGNGTADDSAAFTAAFAAADAEIYVPHGTYIVTGLTLTGKKLYGPGTLKWKAASASNMLTLASGASIEGLTFDGNAANQTGTVVGIVTLVSPKTRIIGCNFTAFRYKVIESDLAASPDCIVQGCIFHDTCTITSGNGVGIRSPRWRVENCSFLTWGADGHMIRTGILTGDDTSVPISDVAIIGNTFYGLSVYGSAAITMAQYSTDITISGNNFRNLTQAIKGDNAGVTVKRISITGNTFKTITGLGAFNIEVNDVTFSGNTAINCADSVLCGNNSVISNNVLDNVGAASAGIASIRQPSSATATVISGNRIQSAPSDGINCAGGSATVIGNRIKTAAAYGIAMFASNNIINGNTVDGAVTGIYLSSTSTYCTISGNVVISVTTAYNVSNSASFATCFVDMDSNIGNLGLSLTHTISSGSITVGRSETICTVDTEGSASTDDLDTIVIGPKGQRITLKPGSSSRVVTVKDGTGNIQLAGSASRVLSDTYDTLTLISNGTVWLEQAFSDNG